MTLSVFKGRGMRMIIMLTLLVPVLITSCASVPSVKAPEGFAVYERRTDFLAVSPEGVRFKVRYEKNRPEQTLDFWREALEVHLTSSGYDLLSGDTFDTPDGKGSYLEWVAPVGEEDWIYLTAITVQGDKIAIAEAAGPFQMYRKYRDTLFESLGSITFPRGRGS